MIEARLIKFFYCFSVVAALSGCQESGEPGVTDAKLERHRPALLAEVQSADNGLRRQYPGVVAAAESAGLGFRVAGVLVELPVAPGSRVRKGELLAQLDQTDFVNALQGRKAERQLAKVQYEQMRELNGRKLASQLQLEQSLAALRSADAALAQAEANLRYSHLQAPFDGIVGRVSTDNYQAVAAGSPLIQLQRLDLLDVVISVPETVVAQLSPQPDAATLSRLCGRVQFTTHPEQAFQACLLEYESVPESTTRNYQARFRLDPVEQFVVLPGMSVSVDIDFSLLADQADTPDLVIPLEAVFEAEGQHWVWRLDDQQRARRQQVILARLAGDRMALLDGLSEGDLVVAAGVSSVREGMLLRPLVKERGL